MKSKQLNKIVISALFASIICVVTIAVHIPLPSGYGYINIGDAFVLTAGILLGPVYGGLAAAIGSGLSDLILGYAAYIPATAIIKGLMAVLIYFLSKTFKKHKNVGISIGCVFGELPMPFLYLLYEYAILKYGASAIANLPFNLIQGAISAFISIFIIIALNKTNLQEKYL